MFEEINIQHRPMVAIHFSSSLASALSLLRVNVGEKLVGAGVGDWVSVVGGGGSGSYCACTCVFVCGGGGGG